MDWQAILLHPFTLGLALGLLLTAIVLLRLWGLKRELARYKRLLSDKLEVDAENQIKSKKQHETLQKENENLRSKVQSLSQLPDRQELRDLEVFARAEKKLTIDVPGFAQAWERAKNDAANEIHGEEHGDSLPGRVFRKLFKSEPAKKPTDDSKMIQSSNDGAE